MIKRGFTLVELLIVMVVMTILFNVGYANYRNYARRQQFQGSLRKIDGDIRMAQTLASSGTKPYECASLKGYRFEADIGAKQYSIIPVCGDGTEGTVVKTETLGGDVDSITTAGGTDNGITFYVLGRGTDIDQTLESAFVITLTQAATSKTATVTVTPGGGVSYSSN